MKHDAFISYADADVSLVENLRDHLGRFGVNAWMYSYDRTLAADAWVEIKEQVNKCRIGLFMVSKNTPNAHGQHRELELALNKLEGEVSSECIFPVILDDIQFSSLPEKLRYKNGLKLDQSSVKSTALKIAKLIFPGKFSDESIRLWKHPIPGEWLEISNIDPALEKYFDLGDPLYFRQISPIGLFECYSPKIKGLFWVFPDNVRMAEDQDKYEVIGRDVPFVYTISGLLEIQRRGWDSWHKYQESKTNKSMQ